MPPETRRQFVGGRVAFDCADRRLTPSAIASQNENRDGLTDLIGADRFFNHLEEALEVFH